MGGEVNQHGAGTIDCRPQIVDRLEIEAGASGEVGSERSALWSYLVELMHEGVCRGRIDTVPSGRVVILRRYADSRPAASS
jgi:hypothetical protein